MCKSAKNNFFNLVKACKDCPFKKGQSYLSREGLLLRIEQVRSEDLTFRCHKTIAYGEREQLTEIENSIQEELSSMPASSTTAELEAKRIELAQEFGLDEAILAYKPFQDAEMMCAGMMILAKKEGFVFNNRALRFAVISGILNLDQYKDEDQVYDTIEQAVQAHSGNRVLKTKMD